MQEPKIKIMKNDLKLPRDDEDVKPWLNEVYKKRYLGANTYGFKILSETFL